LAWWAFPKESERGREWDIINNTAIYNYYF